MTASVMVFTRDLRITDNPALAAAALAGDTVPLFVLDDAIVRRHRQNATRIAFLLECLHDLDAHLRALGGHLLVARGPWTKTVLTMASQAGATQIHLAADVSGYAQRRLASLRAAARAARLNVTAHPGVMAAGPSPIRTAAGGHYQVFTPYYRSWQAAPRRPSASTPTTISVPPGTPPGKIPELAELTTARPAAARAPGGETQARARLNGWAATRLVTYHRDHDDLAADATSRLSPYLHLGCLSPLELAVSLASQPGGEPFVRQLAWRDFFCQLLQARPQAAREDVRERGDRWHEDPGGLAAWQAGQTGFPVVDAAMRQLAAEGFMHNRARMVVASFLTKDLRIDWRAGAAHFMALLADADLACNQLNWQWVAGTGTDSQRHRVFSPVRQGTRFDPRGEYVARYVPELAGLPPSAIHDPAPQIRRQRHYPAPIVDHRAAVAAWRAVS